MWANKSHESHKIKHDITTKTPHAAFCMFYGIHFTHIVHNAYWSTVNYKMQFDCPEKAEGHYLLICCKSNKRNVFVSETIPFLLETERIA